MFHIILSLSFCYFTNTLIQEQDMVFVLKLQMKFQYLPMDSTNVKCKSCMNKYPKIFDYIKELTLAKFICFYNMNSYKKIRRE
jgi:hypothetical protein